MQITNGIVVFERTVRPADFESKKASVTLSFAFDPDEAGDRSAVIDHVGELARHHCLNMLGVTDKVPEPATEPKRIRRTAPPVAETPPAPLPETTAPSASDATTAAVASEPAASASSNPQLTDKALADACAAKVSGAADRAMMTNKVKELRTKFTGDPIKSIATVGDLGKRAEFLAELGAL